MGSHIIYPPPARRVPNGFFSTKPLHRWLLNDAASPYVNYGTAASGLTMSNAGSGGTITAAQRGLVDKGVLFINSASSTNRACIYTANPAAGDVVSNAGQVITFMCWAQFRAITGNFW